MLVGGLFGLKRGGGGVTRDTRCRRRCSCLDPRGRGLGGGGRPRLPRGRGGMPFLRWSGIWRARRCRAKVGFEGGYGEREGYHGGLHGIVVPAEGTMHRVQFLWHPEAKRGDGDFNLMQSECRCSPSWRTHQTPERGSPATGGVARQARRLLESHGGVGRLPACRYR